MKALPFISTVFLLLSCSSAKYYDTQILDIPGQKNDLLVNVPTYFDDETPDLPPYLELIEFAEEDEGTMSRAKVASIMSKKALENGLDAVINIWYDKWNEQGTTSYDMVMTVTDEEGNEYRTYKPNFFLRGTGVKFLKNMNYINGIPEYEIFYSLQNGEKVLYMDIEYKATGEVYNVIHHQASSHSFYLQYFKEYTDYHLLSEREGWMYRKPGSGVIKRMYFQNDQLVKSCRIKLNIFNKPEEIYISFNIFHPRYSGEYIYHKSVKYTYDKFGLVTSKQIEYDNNSKLIISYLYKGTQLKGSYYELYEKGKLELALSSRFQFFSKDYIEGYYEQLSKVNSE